MMIEFNVGRRASRPFVSSAKRLNLIVLLVCGVLATTAAQASERPIRSRTFQMTYEVSVKNIPGDAKSLELWVPLPQSDRDQTVHQLTIAGPSPLNIGRDSEFANQILHCKTAPSKDPVKVSVIVDATRRENAGWNVPLSESDREFNLRSEPLVPLDGPVRALAEETTRGMTGDAEKARAIYEKVTGMMKYDKSGIGWGRGDAIFACDAKRGNCTDFHALVIGMARSVGIPARFSMGLPLPDAHGEGVIPGYHCWAELYVDGRGWVPVDSSEAAKHPDKRDYFFGHHDENRLEFSRGRNLVLAPPQQGSRLNFFIYPYVEVDGKPHEAVERKITFADLAPRATGQDSRH